MVYAGTIIEIDKEKTFLMTMDLSIIEVKTRPEYFLGKSVTYSKKDLYRNREILKFITSPKILGIVAAVLLLIIGAIAGIGALNSKDEVPETIFDSNCTALVSVDINPSIEIEVNKDNKIIKVISKNEDGATVIKDLDLLEKDVLDGVNEIIEKSDLLGFIKDGAEVILVSAASYDGAREEYVNELKDILNTIEGSEEDKIIMTLYIDDDTVVKDAKDNELSIGKQYLLEYAESHNLSVSQEEIQELTIENILERLDISDSVPEETKEVVLEGETEKESEETTTEKVTEKATEKTTEKETEKVIEETTEKLEINYELAASEVDGGIYFKWTKAPSSNGFKYYKIVASKSDSTPIYPENGYALYITDTGYVEKVIKTGASYTNGDFSKFEGGETYYFSITYVYEDNKFVSNTIKIKMPVNKEEETTTQTQVSYITPILAIGTGDGTVKFSWTKIGTDPIKVNGIKYSGFKYYKVVASKTDSTPVYPDNGYIYYTSDMSKGSWAPLAENMGLESGETYYFAITYVFENGKFTSNTIKKTIPVYKEESEEIEVLEISPVMTIKTSAEGLGVSWTALTSSESVIYKGTQYKGFKYYKVVASKSDSTPEYPENGYVTYTNDISKSYYTITKGMAYNNGDFSQFQSGETYYISITYFFESGKFTSNVIKTTCP